MIHYTINDISQLFVYFDITNYVQKQFYQNLQVVNTFFNNEKYILRLGSLQSSDQESQSYILASFKKDMGKV